MNNGRRNSTQRSVTGNATLHGLTSNSSTKVGERYDDFIEQDKYLPGGIRPNDERDTDTTIQRIELDSPDFESGIRMKTAKSLKEDFVSRHENFVIHDKNNNNNNSNSNSNGYGYGNNKIWNSLEPKSSPDDKFFTRENENGKNSHARLNLSRRFNYRYQHRHTSENVRNLIGDPLPLPYLSKGPDSKRTGSHIVHDPKIRQSVDKSIRKPLTLDELDKRRHIMNTKWRKLLNSDQNAVNFKLNGLPKLDHLTNDAEDDDVAGELNILKQEPSRLNTRHSSLHRDLNIRSRGASVSLQPFSHTSESTISCLQDEINANGRKLDQILQILSEGHQQRSTPRVAVSREVLCWSLCIVVLLACNVVVYCL